MTRPLTHNSQRARRNAVVMGGTAGVVGLVMLYPTSTNSSVAPRKPGQALAPAGIVAAPKTASATQVVNGTSTDTQFGPVQVQLKIRSRKIVSVTAIDYPQGTGTDQQINGYAIPILDREALTAQSAQIDTVSGATYTSDGYRQSLQSALDAAHLG